MNKTETRGGLQKFWFVGLGNPIIFFLTCAGILEEKLRKDRLWLWAEKLLKKAG